VTYPAPYPPFPHYGPPPAPRENKLATGALVCSLAGFFTVGLSAIAGIVLGHLAYGRARRGEAGGLGIATAAFICGYVILALWVGFGVTFTLLVTDTIVNPLTG
jgi:hypothetical protein